MPEDTVLNSSGLPQYHLKRNGPPATVDDVADVMDFHKITTLIGRNRSQVDYVLDSRTYTRGAYISRNHARMVRQVKNSDAHRLFDDSRNGIFVNNMKIAGSVVLSEGDLVTFGHPNGEKIPPGLRVRQPDSEYQFLFERCTGHPDTAVPCAGSGEFVVPAVKSPSKSGRKKRDRNTTQSFTCEDVRKLRDTYQAEVEKKDLDCVNKKSPKKPSVKNDTETMSDTRDLSKDECQNEELEYQNILPSEIIAQSNNKGHLNKPERTTSVNTDKCTRTVDKATKKIKGKISPKKDASMQTSQDYENEFKVSHDSKISSVKKKSPTKDASMQTSPPAVNHRSQNGSSISELNTNNNVSTSTCSNTESMDFGNREIVDEQPFENLKINFSNETGIVQEHDNSVADVNDRGCEFAMDTGYESAIDRSCESAIEGTKNESNRKAEIGSLKSGSISCSEGNQREFREHDTGLELHISEKERCFEIENYQKDAGSSNDRKQRDSNLFSSKHGSETVNMREGTIARSIEHCDDTVLTTQHNSDEKNSSVKANEEIAEQDLLVDDSGGRVAEKSVSASPVAHYSCSSFGKVDLVEGVTVQDGFDDEKTVHPSVDKKVLSSAATQDKSCVAEKTVSETDELVQSNHCIPKETDTTKDSAKIDQNVTTEFDEAMEITDQAFSADDIIVENHGENAERTLLAEDVVVKNDVEIIDRTVLAGDMTVHDDVSIVDQTVSAYLAGCNSSDIADQTVSADLAGCNSSDIVNQTISADVIFNSNSDIASQTISAKDRSIDDYGNKTDETVSYMVEDNGDLSDQTTLANDVTGDNNEIVGDSNEIAGQTTSTEDIVVNDNIGTVDPQPVVSAVIDNNECISGQTVGAIEETNQAVSAEEVIAQEGISSIAGQMMLQEAVTFLINDVKPGKHVYCGIGDKTILAVEATGTCQIVSERETDANAEQTASTKNILLYDSSGTVDAADTSDEMSENKDGIEKIDNVDNNNYHPLMFSNSIDYQLEYEDDISEELWGDNEQDLSHDTSDETEIKVSDVSMDCKVQEMFSEHVKENCGNKEIDLPTQQKDFVSKTDDQIENTDSEELRSECEKNVVKQNGVRDDEVDGSVVEADEQNNEAKLSLKNVIQQGTKTDDGLEDDNSDRKAEINIDSEITSFLYAKKPVQTKVELKSYNATRHSNEDIHITVGGECDMDDSAGYSALNKQETTGFKVNENIQVTSEFYTKGETIRMDLKNLDTEICNGSDKKKENEIVTPDSLCNDRTVSMKKVAVFSLPGNLESKEHVESNRIDSVVQRNDKLRRNDDNEIENMDTKDRTTGNVVTIIDTFQNSVELNSENMNEEIGVESCKGQTDLCVSQETFPYREEKCEDHLVKESSSNNPGFELSDKDTDMLKNSCYNIGEHMDSDNVNNHAVTNFIVNDNSDIELPSQNDGELQKYPQSGNDAVETSEVVDVDENSNSTISSVHVHQSGNYALSNQNADKLNECVTIGNNPVEINGVFIVGIDIDSINARDNVESHAVKHFPENQISGLSSQDIVTTKESAKNVDKVDRKHFPESDNSELHSEDVEMKEYVTTGNDATKTNEVVSIGIINDSNNSSHTVDNCTVKSFPESENGEVSSKVEELCDSQGNDDIKTNEEVNVRKNSDPVNSRDNEDGHAVTNSPESDISEMSGQDKLNECVAIGEKVVEMNELGNNGIDIDSISASDYAESPAVKHIPESNIHELFSQNFDKLKECVTTGDTAGEMHEVGSVVVDSDSTNSSVMVDSHAVKYFFEKDSSEVCSPDFDELEKCAKTGYDAIKPNDVLNVDVNRSSTNSNTVDRYTAKHFPKSENSELSSQDADELKKYVGTENDSVKTNEVVSDCMNRDVINSCDNIDSHEVKCPISDNSYLVSRDVDDLKECAKMGNDDEANEVADVYVNIESTDNSNVDNHAVTNITVNENGNIEMPVHNIGEMKECVIIENNAVNSNEENSQFEVDNTLEVSIPEIKPSMDDDKIALEKQEKDMELLPTETGLVGESLKSEMCDTHVDVETKNETEVCMYQNLNKNVNSSNENDINETVAMKSDNGIRFYESMTNSGGCSKTFQSSSIESMEHEKHLVASDKLLDGKNLLKENSSATKELTEEDDVETEENPASEELFSPDSSIDVVDDEHLTSESVTDLNQQMNSMSPLSKHIVALQEFDRLLSPHTKSSEPKSCVLSDNDMISPVTKQKMDRAEISEMISHLEESISSADDTSECFWNTKPDVSFKETESVGILEEAETVMADAHTGDQNGNTNVSSINCQMIGHQNNNEMERNMTEIEEIENKIITTDDRQLKDNINVLESGDYGEKLKISINRISEKTNLIDDDGFATSECESKEINQIKPVGEKVSQHEKETNETQSDQIAIDGSEKRNSEEKLCVEITEISEDTVMSASANKTSSSESDDIMGVDRSNILYTQIERVELPVRDIEDISGENNKVSRSLRDSNQKDNVDKENVCYDNSHMIESNVTEKESSFLENNSNIVDEKTNELETEKLSQVIPEIVTNSVNFESDITIQRDSISSTEADLDEEDEYGGLSQVFPVIMDKSKSHESLYDQSLLKSENSAMNEDENLQIEDENGIKEYVARSVEYFNQQEVPSELICSGKTNLNVETECERNIIAVESEVKPGSDLIPNEAFSDQSSENINECLCDDTVQSPTLIQDTAEIVSNHEVEVKSSLPAENTDITSIPKTSEQVVVEKYVQNDTTDMSLSEKSTVQKEILIDLQERSPLQLEICQSDLAQITLTSNSISENRGCSSVKKLNNGHKRKLAEIENVDESDQIPKRVCVESETPNIFDTLRTTLSDFFRIKERVKKTKNLSAKSLKKQLIGKIVKHFFKTGCKVQEKTEDETNLFQGCSNILSEDALMKVSGTSVDEPSTGQSSDLSVNHDFSSHLVLGRCSDQGSGSDKIKSLDEHIVKSSEMNVEIIDTSKNLGKEKQDDKLVDSFTCDGGLSDEDIVIWQRNTVYDGNPEREMNMDTTLERKENQNIEIIEAKGELKELTYNKNESEVTIRDQDDTDMICGYREVTGRKGGCIEFEEINSGYQDDANLASGYNFTQTEKTVDVEKMNVDTLLVLDTVDQEPQILCDKDKDMEVDEKECHLQVDQIVETQVENQEQKSHREESLLQTMTQQQLEETVSENLTSNCSKSTAMGGSLEEGLSDGESGRHMEECHEQRDQIVESHLENQEKTSPIDKSLSQTSIDDNITKQQLTGNLTSNGSDDVAKDSSLQGGLSARQSIKQQKEDSENSLVGSYHPVLDSWKLVYINIADRDTPSTSFDSSLPENLIESETTTCDGCMSSQTLNAENNDSPGANEKTHLADISSQDSKIGEKISEILKPTSEDEIGVDNVFVQKSQKILQTSGSLTNIENKDEEILSSEIENPQAPSLSFNSDEESSEESQFLLNIPELNCQTGSGDNNVNDWMGNEKEPNFKKQALDDGSDAEKDSSNDSLQNESSSKASPKEKSVKFVLSDQQSRYTNENEMNDVGDSDQTLEDSEEMNSQKSFENSVKNVSTSDIEIISLESSVYESQQSDVSEYQEKDSLDDSEANLNFNKGSDLDSSNDYFGTQSRLPDMESESDSYDKSLLEKAMTIKKKFHCKVETFCESSEELPEVIFLRHEKPPHATENAIDKKPVIKREIVSDSDSDYQYKGNVTPRKKSPKKKIKRKIEEPICKITPSKKRAKRSKRKTPKKRGRNQQGQNYCEDIDFIVISASDTDSDIKTQKSTTDVDSDVLERVKDTDMIDCYQGGSVQDLFNSEEFNEASHDTFLPAEIKTENRGTSDEDDEDENVCDRSHGNFDRGDDHITPNEEGTDDGDNGNNINDQKRNHIDVDNDAVHSSLTSQHVHGDENVDNREHESEDMIEQETVLPYGVGSVEEVNTSKVDDNMNKFKQMKQRGKLETVVKGNQDMQFEDITAHKNDEVKMHTNKPENIPEKINSFVELCRTKEMPDHDMDYVENTCDSESEAEIVFPVLQPLSPASYSRSDSSIISYKDVKDVTVDVKNDQCLQGKTIQNPDIELSCQFDDNDFSPPVVNMAALDSESEHEDNHSQSQIGESGKTATDLYERTKLQSEIDDSGNNATVLYERTKSTVTEQEVTLEANLVPNEEKENFADKVRKRRLFDDQIDTDFQSPKKRYKSGDEGQVGSSNKKTQLSLDMEVCTQSPFVNNVSDSQFQESTKHFMSDINKRGTPTKKKKAKELLAKLKAKRNKFKTQHENQSSNVLPSSQEMIESASCNTVARRSEAEETNQSIDEHISRCKEIVCRLKEDFDSKKNLRNNPRIVQWKKEILDIEKTTKLPGTVIAVVGDTGSGKSSLMNAVIDQLDVLPTSGVRACTAVVVEIMENKRNDNFEADIQFLSKMEWYDELNLLLKDLTGPDGKIKKYVPDPQSEAGVAYLKIKAVYGKIDTFDVLSRYQTVTRWLDKTRTISLSNAKDFRKAIDKYIETADPGTGGQCWPIVKLVTLRLPKCDVCSSGAVLVDLPGVRDSNAARDKIARDYLKKCTAVWVVSSIHRAIDDKTAKELLGENFRRQLLMDGQYGSIAFICTKSDILVPSEIIQDLDLENQTDPLENEIKGLQMEKADADLKVSSTNDEIRQLRKTVRTVQEEIKELKQDLDSIQEELNDSMDQDDTEIYQQIKECKDDLASKEEMVRLTEGDIRAKELTRNDANRRSLEIEKEISYKRKEIATICAKSRNEYAKREIKKDFKAGLREMKRKAGMTVDEDDDDMVDDYDSENDEEDIGSTANNLKVFCVSSVEYQKIKKILANNGPPTVFNTMEDTGILALRAFVHEMTSKRRLYGLQRMIRNTARFVFDVQNYLMDNGTECKGTRLSARSAIEGRATELQERFEPIIERLSNDITEAFNGSIRPKLQDGAIKACSSAVEIQENWGKKPNRENRKEGGYHHSTYKAIVRRQGVYKSPTYGAVDMNEELSEPMYRSITISWDKVFSGMLWNALETCRSLLLATLKQFTTELCGELHSLGVPRDRTCRVQEQLLNSSASKLTEMVNEMKEYITSSQRDISRVLTPVVQENLGHTYDNCASQSGGGMFNRMKECMTSGVDNKRFCMFDEASSKLLEDLLELQSQIIERVRYVCRNLCELLQTSFEPLWEAPVNTKILREALFEGITDISLAIAKLQDDAKLPSTERALVPFSDTQATSVVQDSTPLAVNYPSCFIQEIANQITPSAAPSNNMTTSTTSSSEQLFESNRRLYEIQRMLANSRVQIRNVTVEERRTSYTAGLLTQIKHEPEEEDEIRAIKREQEENTSNADCMRRLSYDNRSIKLENSSRLATSCNDSRSSGRAILHTTKSELVQSSSLSRSYTSTGTQAMQSGKPFQSLACQSKSKDMYQRSVTPGDSRSVADTSVSHTSERNYTASKAMPYQYVTTLGNTVIHMPECNTQTITSFGNSGVTNTTGTRKMSTPIKSVIHQHNKQTPGVSVSGKVSTPNITFIHQGGNKQTPRSVSVTGKVSTPNITLIHQGSNKQMPGSVSMTGKVSTPNITFIQQGSNKQTPGNVSVTGKVSTPNITFIHQGGNKQTPGNVSVTGKVSTPNITFIQQGSNKQTPESVSVSEKVLTPNKTYIQKGSNKQTPESVSVSGKVSTPGITFIHQGGNKQKPGIVSVSGKLSTPNITFIQQGGNKQTPRSVSVLERTSTPSIPLIHQSYIKNTPRSVALSGKTSTPNLSLLYQHNSNQTPGSVSVSSITTTPDKNITNQAYNNQIPRRVSGTILPHKPTINIPQHSRSGTQNLPGHTNAQQVCKEKEKTAMFERNIHGVKVIKAAGQEIGPVQGKTSKVIAMTTGSNSTSISGMTITDMSNSKSPKGNVNLIKVSDNISTSDKTENCIKTAKEMTKVGQPGNVLSTITNTAKNKLITGLQKSAKSALNKSVSNEKEKEYVNKSSTFSSPCSKNSGNNTNVTNSVQGTKSGGKINKLSLSHKRIGSSPMSSSQPSHGSSLYNTSSLYYSSMPKVKEEPIHYVPKRKVRRAEMVELATSSSSEDSD